MPTASDAQLESRFEILPSNQPTADDIRDNILQNPGFGKYFTDHMAHVRWTVDADWHGHQVRPYGPLTLDPAASVLHYGQEIFEGIKRTAMPMALSGPSAQRKTPSVFAVALAV